MQKQLKQKLYHKPLISVIVPVYNVETYLCQCVDSIINQTYENLDIILVEGGSIDNSGSICEEYSRNDDRVRVIHDRKGGLSYARNMGIEIANGEYLLFIDSDDWIDHDLVEILYENLVKNEADISVCSLYISYVNKCIPHYKGNREIVLLDSEQSITHSLIGEKFTVSAWGKLYKKHLFTNIRFPVGKYYEDLFIVVDVFSEAKSIIADIVPKYYYRKRQSSQAQGDLKNPINFDHIMAAETALMTIKKRHPNIINVGEWYMLSIVTHELNKAILLKDYSKLPNYHETIHIIKELFYSLIRNRFISRNEKIKLIILRINVRLYKYFQSINWLKPRVEESNIMFE